MNKRLAKIARGIMSCYAIRWKVIRRDPNQREHADWLLFQAVRMRELSIKILGENGPTN